MQIQITGHNFEVSEALKNLVTSKLQKIEKHKSNIMRIHITFEVNKLVHNAKATLSLPGNNINAEGKSENMYKAVDVLIDKIDRQLRDLK